MTGQEVNQIALPERWAGDIVCCATTQRAFVCNTWSGRVYVLDTPTGTPLHAVDVGGKPFVLGTAALEASQRIAIGVRYDRYNGEVILLDAQSGSLCSRVKVGREPGSYVVDDRRDCLYVGADRPPFLSVISGAEAAVMGTLPVSGVMLEGVIDPVQDVLFVLMTTHIEVVSLASRTVVEQYKIEDIYAQIGAPLGPPRLWQAGIDIQQRRLFLCKALENGTTILVMLDAQSLQPLRWQRAGHMPMGLLVDEHAHDVCIVDSNTQPPDFSSRRGPSGIRIFDSITGKKRQVVEAGDRLAGAAISQLYGTLLAVDWFDKAYLFRRN